MSHRICFVIAAAVLAAAPACKKATPASLFGAGVIPPKGLDKLRPGMTIAEAKAAVPGLSEQGDKGLLHELVLDSGLEDVKLIVHLDDDRVRDVTAMIRDPHATDLLTKLWGKPEMVKSFGGTSPTWRDAARGWQADIDCLRRTCHVRFTPYQPLDAGFFGKAPRPPGVLAKIAIGMTMDEAKAAAPGIELDRITDAGPTGVTQVVHFDHTSHRVRAVRLQVPATAKALLAKAWGPGIASTDDLGKPRTVWFGTETGWRASLEPALVGDGFGLELTAYQPAAKLLGTGPAIAALGAPVLGQTVAQVRAAFGDRFVEEHGSHWLQLAPTEWASYWTRISLYEASGKIARLSIPLAYGGSSKARDELLALLTHKWGAPKQEQEFGQTRYVFHAAGPKISAQDNTILKEWDVEVE